MRSMKMFQSMTIWSLICAIQVQAVLVVEFKTFSIGDTSDDSCCEEHWVLLERLLVMVNVQSRCMHPQLTAVADGSIFPACIDRTGNMLTVNMKSLEQLLNDALKYCNTDAVRDREIRLKDISGCSFRSTERVARSDKVRPDLSCALATCSTV